LTACLFALVGCFSETDTNDDDDNDDNSTTGNTTDPTLSTTTVDPSVTTSMTSMTSMTTTSSDPTSETDPSVDSTGTTDSDTDPSTTTDPTAGECPGEGAAACNDDMAAEGELCFLVPEATICGTEQIGDYAIADIDDDGDADLAYSDGLRGYVSFVANGTLQQATPVGVRGSTWSVAAGSLGVDGEVAVVFGAAANVVNIARFVGNSVTTDDPLPAPGEFVTVRLGDFDDDNHLDLVVGSEESASIFIYVNDGFGALTTYSVLDLGAVSGVIDMRVLEHVGYDNPGLAVLTREGRLIWSPPSATPGLASFTEIDSTQSYGDPSVAMLAAGDLDNDDDTDLAVGYDGRAFVFRATKIGYMEPQVLGEGAVGDVAVAIADVDNDGFADVLLADPNATEIVMYIADEDGFMLAKDAIQVPAMPRGVGLADFNADCAADVFALGPTWLEVSESNP